MKKEYEKPVFAVEMLKVSEHIANCAASINFSAHHCYVDTGFSRLFLDHDPCNYDMGKGHNHFDKYCYHVPLGQGSFFQS